MIWPILSSGFPLNVSSLDLLNKSITYKVNFESNTISSVKLSSIEKVVLFLSVEINYSNLIAIPRAPSQQPLSLLFYIGCRSVRKWKFKDSNVKNKLKFKGYCMYFEWELQVLHSTNQTSLLVISIPSICDDSFCISPLTGIVLSSSSLCSKQEFFIYRLKRLRDKINLFELVNSEELSLGLESFSKLCFLG